MNVGAVVGGIGIVAGGMTWYLIISRTSNAQLRGVAASRWWLDRRLYRSLRRGEVTRAQWIEQSVPVMRTQGRAGLRPFVGLILVIGVCVAIHGITSP